MFCNSNTFFSSDGLVCSRSSLAVLASTRNGSLLHPQALVLVLVKVDLAEVVVVLEVLEVVLLNKMFILRAKV
jgi:hypothetical protein